MTFQGADGFNPYGPVEKGSERRFLDIAVADLIGFRAWQMRVIRYGSEHGRGVLRSVTYDAHVWGRGPHRAMPCNLLAKSPAEPNPYHPPRVDCSHGYYAYHHTERYEYAKDGEKGVVIEGLIRGWGRTVIGDLGFRSEWAQIVALVVPHDRVFPKGWLQANNRPEDGIGTVEEVTVALEERYDVPVYSSVRAMLDDHPLTGPIRRSP